MKKPKGKLLKTFELLQIEMALNARAEHLENTEEPSEVLKGRRMEVAALCRELATRLRNAEAIRIFELPGKEDE